MSHLHTYQRLQTKHKTDYLFVTSKIEFSISPILQFLNLECCITAKEPFKTPFEWCNILSLYFFILKAFCNTLNSRIGEFDF